MSKVNRNLRAAGGVLAGMSLAGLAAAQQVQVAGNTFTSVGDASVAQGPNGSIQLTAANGATTTVQAGNFVIQNGVVYVNADALAALQGASGLGGMGVVGAAGAAAAGLGALMLGGGSSTADATTPTPTPTPTPVVTDTTAPTITSGATQTVSATTTGTLFSVTATDVNDSGTATTGITYSLDAASDALFSIDASTGAVTFDSSIDALTESAFADGETITVTATDASGNPTSSAVAIIINDQTPADTTNPVFDASVAATATTAATTAAYNAGVLFDVNATDNGGANDVGVTYTLDASSLMHFDIDANTGEITFKSGADVSGLGAEQLTVTATDAAGNTASEVLNLTVTQGVDSTLPTFTATAITKVAASINENDDGTTAFATIDATDDSGTAVTYMVYDNAGTGAIDYASVSTLFEIDANGGVSLIAGQTVMQGSTYSIGVVATDAAGNIATNSSSDVDGAAPGSFPGAHELTLTVDDVDHAVTYASPTLALTIGENATSGDAAMTLDTVPVAGSSVANDADADAISYTTTDTNFAVNSVTGAITYIGSDPSVIDFDSGITSYSFDVVASSTSTVATGSVVSTATQTVTVAITDVDEAPTVDTTATGYDTAGSKFAFTMDETDTVGTAVGTAPAVDPEGGTVTYAFNSGALTDGAFTIDAATGAITTNAAVDFETTTSTSVAANYTGGVATLSVVATDAGANASSAYTVEVTVNDVMDTLSTVDMSGYGSYALGGAVNGTDITIAVDDATTDVVSFGTLGAIATLETSLTAPVTLALTADTTNNTILAGSDSIQHVFDAPGTGTMQTGTTSYTLASNTATAAATAATTLSFGGTATQQLDVTIGQSMVQVGGADLIDVGVAMDASDRLLVDDVNADGNLDLVVFENSADAFTVFLGNNGTTLGFDNFTADDSMLDEAMTAFKAAAGVTDVTDVALGDFGSEEAIVFGTSSAITVWDLAA